jgi:Domain of unknown function (DUF2341)
MKTHFYLKLLIVSIILIGLNMSAIAQCNCTWQYRTPITVTNLGATALTDYQVSITVNTQALVTAGKMQASGNDIRFTDANCTNLPYWIESGMNTTTTIIWIKVNSIPVGPAATVNMYYGNAVAGAATDGNSTFMLFDDFNGASLDGTKWTFVQSGATAVVAGGTVTLSTGTYAEVESIASFAAPIYSEMKVNSTSGSYPCIAQADNGNYNSGATMFTNSTQMFFSATSSTPAFGGSLVNGLTYSTGVGIWKFARTSTGITCAWPGGTNTLASFGTVAPQTTAFGRLNGSAGSIVVDWFRVRQYYAAGTTQVLGTEVVNFLNAITGTTFVCQSSSTTLASTTGGGSWSSSNIAVATVGSSSGIVTGVTAGTSVITYTMPGGCSVTANVTVSPITPISGITSFCAGQTSSLSDGTPGGTWSSGNTAVATVTSGGVVTGVSVGSANIFYTMPVTGCSAVATAFVTSPPSNFTITGGGSYCSGGTGPAVGLNSSTTGVSYQLYNGATTVGLPVLGTGAAINFGFQTAAGNYTVIANPSTGCATTMTGTATISISPLPTAFSVTGGGSYCSGGTGVHVGLTSSTIGTNYQLYYGASPIGAAQVGTGSSLDMGSVTSASPPNYTIIATNATTFCTNTMAGNATVSINSLPSTFAITGGGSYCLGGSGVAVGLAGSTVGISYQLYQSGSPVGAPVSGTGSAISFGLQTGAGTYSVIATNTATGCVNSMSGPVVVSINPLPTVFSVTGGGAYCMGGTGVAIGLNGSTIGVNYQ